jgi:hypothetical protein
MNSKYFALLITIILDSGLRQPTISAQASQLVLTSTSTDVFVQGTVIALEPPPPPDQGAPGGREGAASHAT